jgi:8-oxo-dGTP pyrophosphatase MutT (NUDIX family)
VQPEKPAIGIPRPASTLILLREGDLGPEVLMLKRHGLSDVLGEAYVFPGGKLDDSDQRLSPVRFLDESPGVLQARLNEVDSRSEMAVGLFVAAIREACEECGILLAHGVEQSKQEQVAMQLRSGSSFEHALSEIDGRLAASQLWPWSRWITPVSRLQAKRFDTRFFVARAPSNAMARHDGHEATETAWMQPREALDRYRDGQINLAPPQIMTPAELARYDSVVSVLEVARERPPYRIEPYVLDTPEGLVLCFPGDDAHPVAQPAMPGPSRLAVLNRRYEPVAGWEALFT